MTEFNFENAEGAETRTRKLEILKDELELDDTRLDIIEGAPLVHLEMFATPPVSQVANTSYSKVTVMDTINVTRGVITASAITDNVTIGVTGIYQISINVNIASAGSTELVFSMFVDGVQHGAEVYLQGQGTTKPAFVGGTYFIEFTTGQTIDIRFKSNTNTTAYFYSCGLSIIKI
jgi:hypothetical protein